MAQRCDICGRKPQTTTKRSHSMQATLCRHYLNLQTRRVKGKKIKICTKCLKAQMKTK